MQRLTKRNIKVINHDTGQQIDFPTFGKEAGEDAYNQVSNQLTSLQSQLESSIASMSEAIVTDKTLTIEDAPADAKATGDAINNLRGAVGSPLVAATAAAMTDTNKVYVYTGSETGYTNGNWYYYDGTTWVSGGVYNSVVVDVDTTLKVSGKASDSKTVGDTIDQLKEGSLQLDERVTVLEEGSTGSGLTDDIKQAILQIARKVTYVDEYGQDYYNNLYDALYAVTAIRLNAYSIMLTSIGSTQQLTATTTPTGRTVTWESSDTSIATVSNIGLVTSVGYGSCTITVSSGSVSTTCAVAVSQVALTSISADYQQSGTVYNTASLDSLKSDLTVIATYSDSSIATVTEYVLSGTLTVGTSIITVSYGDKTATFNVTVTAAPTLTSISAAYTQSGTIYDTDSLNSLKDDLVVTAHYSDSTSQTVADYTLSGTLVEGTSTITVSYSGMTTTFNVTVSSAPPTLIYNWDFTTGSLIDTIQGITVSRNTSYDYTTIESDGIHMNGAGACIDFGNILTEDNMTIEVDFGTFAREGSGHSRCIMLSASNTSNHNNDGQGFIYRSTGVWSTYFDGSWGEATSYTDPNAFSNKTITVKKTAEKIGFYLGDVLIQERETTDKTYLMIGANPYAYYKTTVKAVRIYRGV